MSDHFKNQVKSKEKQFSVRWNLHRTIIKELKDPVIVHAVQKKEVFKKILEEGKLKLPDSHKSLKKTPYMERLIGTDNCIYYGLGFIYFSSYKWKYNLIFDISFLKSLIYYRDPVSFKIYKKIVNYWFENDKKYLKKVINMNKETHNIIRDYLYKVRDGEVMKFLEFWKIEKELYESIMKYPKKKILFEIINRTKEKYILEHPESEENAREICFTDRSPEMIGRAENDLLKNPNFLGFFIPGKIDKSTMKILRDKYSGKILFDGKKIKII